MLAIREHGQFIPEADNSVQVAFIPNAGIRLLNVSVRDSGAYSVRATFNLHGSLVTHTQTAYVHVTANANGHLVASVQPGTTYNNHTNDYHLVLACSNTNGPLGAGTRILWRTPNHKVLQTTEWRHGVAYLSLPNPVISGDYTCSLATAVASSCLPSHSTAQTGATVHVDGVELRLSLLEAALNGMKSRENELLGKVQSVEAENQALKQQLELFTRPISFSVSVLNSSNYSSDPVLFPNVMANQGGAFNVTSGQFCVPIAGLYVFQVHVTTTNPVPDSSVDTVYFMIDQHPVGTAVSGRPSGYYDTGRKVMVKRLMAGQTVWVENGSSGWHSLPFSMYFSGFLLRA